MEVPCPKSGSAYASGLEHAEIVVGLASDGVEGSARLLAFMKECQDDASVTLRLKTDALHKECNADVSHAFTFSGRKAAIKFHARPLDEVIAWEKQHGEIVPVPDGYFRERRI